MATKYVNDNATKAQSREVKKKLQKDGVDFIYPKEFASEAKYDLFKILLMILNSKFIVALLSLLTTIISFLLNRY